VVELSHELLDGIKDVAGVGHRRLLRHLPRLMGGRRPMSETIAFTVIVLTLLALFGIVVWGP
jgi:hypothetical protein